MASPASTTRSSHEAISLDNVSVPSSSERYQDGWEDGPRYEYKTRQPRQQSLLGSLLAVLGMSTRWRRGGHEYEAAPADDIAPDGLLKRPTPPREGRRWGRSKLLSFVKRVLVVLPMCILLFLGLIHLLEFLIGRARLLGNIEPPSYLPNWGKPGHIGEGLSSYPTDATRDILPIPCHSHNDYWRRIPLFDAIHWGCTGVEADVWLFDDELFVGHNLAALTPNRTFRSLYVNPLVELLDKMNPSTPFVDTNHSHGVFDVNPSQTLVLLVDFKTNGHDLFPVVHEHLAPLREKNYLSYFNGTNVISRAVTVVGTGNAPFATILNSTHRDVFFDAPLDELWERPRDPFAHEPDEDDEQGAYDDDDEDLSLAPGNNTGSPQGKVDTDIIASFNATNSFYASTSFLAAVGFVWRGHLSPSQMQTIRGQIAGAKRRGLKARYWDTPSWPIGLRNHVWHVLMKEGADVLNVDDLKAAAKETWRARRGGWW